MTRCKSILSLMFVLPMLFVAATSAFGQDSTDVAEYDRLHEQYKIDLRVYESRADDYRRAQAKYNQELESYESEVSWYNSLPPSQRSEFQFNRLNRWKAELDRRCNQLNHFRTTQLVPVYNDLKQRHAKLTEMYDRIWG